MFLFFSVSVEECAFKAPTKYGTHRWTPGGNVLMVHSDDNGDTWSEPQVPLSAYAGMSWPCSLSLQYPPTGPKTPLTLHGTRPRGANSLLHF